MMVHTSSDERQGIQQLGRPNADIMLVHAPTQKFGCATPGNLLLVVYYFQDICPTTSAASEFCASTASCRVSVATSTDYIRAVLPRKKLSSPFEHFNVNSRRVLSYSTFKVILFIEMVQRTASCNFHLFREIQSSQLRYCIIHSIYSCSILPTTLCKLGFLEVMLRFP